MQQLSIIDAADQQFGCVMNNRRVTMRLRYNPTTERWSFDLSLDDSPVLYAYRITLGTDLFSAFEFDIGRLYAVPLVAGAQPNRTGLIDGSVALLHIEEDEVEELRLETAQ